MKKLSAFVTVIPAIPIALFAAAALSPPFCQAKDYIPRDYSIVPPAPQVEALMDFKEYPVDYFRGIPQIIFPLYVLTVGQVEVPITLFYHGGGIRVEQKVGNAGLGWSVICGATISHTVYGAPDASNGRIHGLWHLDDEETEFRRRLMEKEADYEPDNADEYRLKRFWQATLGSRYHEGLTDVANDLYHLYGQELSATFAMLSENNVLVASEKPLEISVNNQVERITDGGCDGWGFLVSTNDGLSYQFSTQDRTKYKYNYGSPELEQGLDSVYYASSWHVSKITDLSGNSVDFTYTPKGTLVWENTVHPIAVGYSNSQLAGMSPSQPGGLSTAEYYAKALTGVEGGGITVTFEYCHMATGDSDALIKSMTIKSQDGDKRKIEFIYSGNFLTQIKDQGETVYRFSYNARNGRFPHFEIAEQDFGGYYNGASDNYSLVPSIIKNCGPVGWDADRSVSPEYAVEGSLKRIEYATGGYTEFEWESNIFSYLNSVPFKGEINSSQITKVETDTLRACAEEGYQKLKIEAWTLREGQTAELDMTHYFDMNPANLFGSAYHDSHASDHYPERNPPHHPHAVISDHATGEIRKVYFLDKETIEPNGIKEVTQLHLSPGTYDFELKYPTEVQGAEDFMETELRYHDCIAGYIYIRKLTTDAVQTGGRKNENWCGLRIKRIVSCAGSDENDVLRKDFYYNRAGDPNETSGTVQMLPKYDYMYYKNVPCQDVPGYESSEVYCVGDIAFPQTANGSLSAIEYPVVSACMGREDRLEPDGYLHYYYETNYYSSARDQNSTDYNFSAFKGYQPVGARMYTSRSHRRGNLEKKIANFYTGPGLTTEYAYNIYEKTDMPVLTTDAFPVCDFRMVPGENTYGSYDYGIGTYTLIPYNKTIGYEGVSQIDGLDSYKRYEYFYDRYTDALDWNLLKTLTANDSEYGETVSHFTYVRGLRCYLPFPETEVTIRGGRVVSASRTEYDSQSRLPLRKFTLSSRTPSADLLSDSQRTTDSQKQAINKLTYEYRYNSRGNLVQISYRGIPLASYIWGYNGQYPIIEASDVDFDTLADSAIQSGLTQGQIDGRTVTSDKEVAALAQQLRNRLPSSQITAISYHWLLGVAKITTPRGDSTSFAYDSRGRLIEVRDFNNYLINKYEYRYATSSSTY